ncbi:hypothetical protein ABZV93_22555 [Actinopolymorpha sp. NPDC004070]|uniref:hypothetical protein n=1 Tax=Actinopolymorpha sp. NPDC004070 TaxID=3154548 RepID=UPI0033A70535
MSTRRWSRASSQVASPAAGSAARSRPDGARRPRARTLSALVLTALLIAFTVPLAGAGARASAAAKAPGRSVAPPGFSPSSTSWTTPRDGWVFGYSVCWPSGPGPGGQCPVLLHTTDGGARWTRVPAPPVRSSPSHDQVRVVFAQRFGDFAHRRSIGLVTNGLELYATYDGGRTWRAEQLAGARTPVYVGDIAATHRTAYVVLASGSGQDKRTEVFRTPIGERAWAAVPGIRLADNGGGVYASGSLAARGSSVAVSLGQVFSPTRYWTSSDDGRAWTSRSAPCRQEASTDLGLSGAGDVYALCSFNPGRGRMDKDVRLAGEGGTFTTVGTAPATGITTGFAVSPHGTPAVGATGGDESFVHASFDGGRSWQTTMAVPERGPVYDLAFTDDLHGTLVAGYADLHTSQLFRTDDGGRTWEPFTAG